MKKLQPAHYTQQSMDQVFEETLKAYESGNPAFTTMFCASDLELVKHKIREFLTLTLNVEKIWKNDKYQVAVTDLEDSDVIHLSIKRLDRKEIKDWRDFQLIKNQLVGEENEAVELYPAESRLVDSANQYHLWVVRDPTFRFKFGFNDRYVSDESFKGSKQRPFTQEKKD